jgi:hypothetical protein
MAREKADCAAAVYPGGGIVEYNVRDDPRCF